MKLLGFKPGVKDDGNGESTVARTGNFLLDRNRNTSVGLRKESGL